MDTAVHGTEDRLHPRLAPKQRRETLTPKQMEVLDWIETLIVPALVDRYIEDQVLKAKAERG